MGDRRSVIEELAKYSLAELNKPLDGPKFKAQRTKIEAIGWEIQAGWADVSGCPTRRRRLLAKWLISTVDSAAHNVVRTWSEQPGAARHESRGEHDCHDEHEFGGVDAAVGLNRESW